VNTLPSSRRPPVRPVDREAQGGLAIGDQALSVLEHHAPAVHQRTHFRRGDPAEVPGVVEVE
jgi:hypothetical protein